MVTVLLIVLVLLLLGALPAWPHTRSYSRSWGYAPSGVLSAALLIIVMLMLVARA